MQNDPNLFTDYGYAAKVGMRLRAFRKEAGFTASVVAEHLNIPTALYLLYEEHELVPHQLIPPLCKLLNFSPWHYLTGLSDELSPPF
jgi:transcriptional regulator with XRE-family HTH domain